MIEEAAGVLGIDPEPLTAAQLWFRYLARARLAWSQTAALCCLIANANRDPKRRPSPFKPADFNPLADRRAHRGGNGGVPINRDTIQSVAYAWTGQRFGERPKPERLDLPRIERTCHGRTTR